jgi:hypothetical protein
MKPNIGVGEYRKMDYQEILNLSEDREDMEPTWEEWKANKNEALLNFHKIGLKTIDVIVTPLELVTYCRLNGLKINGESRAQFITDKLMELNEK